MRKAPKILIAAPQSDVKNYCFVDWLMNIKKFSYPQDRIELYLADNSDTKLNVIRLTEVGITAKYIPKNGRGIIETMVECHQSCVQYAIDNDFDYILHLETDVFPPHDVLSKLMIEDKPIACGLYHILEGAYREPMIRVLEDNNQGYMNAESIRDNQGSYIDGQMLNVFSAGLGCALISKDVFSKIKFRFVEGKDQHPDTWFAMDMKSQDIPISVHTGLVCEHRNGTWGTFNLNFK
tara:strand:+ start:352 stop:1059 length:708 start_codon:yes stop_codon:yes gene_type:complete